MTDGIRVFRNYCKGNMDKTKGEGGNKGGRNKGRETSISCLLHAPQLGNLAYNPNPDWEMNWQPFGSQARHSAH